MNNDLNLPLRTDILDIALNIELTIDSILLSYLNIENDKRKAITNKSGGISFKTKIDLLFDLEIFSKEEHKEFLLLMEFRNQFLHNIDCNSFTYAVDVLGKDKEKSLLKFDDVNFDGDLESRYNNAYRNLHKRTIEVALDKIRKRKKIIDEKARMITIRLKEYVYVTDGFFNIIDKVMEICEPNHSDFIGIFELKMKICKFMKNEIDKLFSTDEYNHLKIQPNSLQSPDKIRKYFK